MLESTKSVMDVQREQEEKERRIRQRAEERTRLGRSRQRMAAELDIFLSECPRYVQCAANENLMFETLAKRNWPISAENLRSVYDDIKDRLVLKDEAPIYSQPNEIQVVSTIDKRFPLSEEIKRDFQSAGIPIPVDKKTAIALMNSEVGKRLYKKWTKYSNPSSPTRVSDEAARAFRARYNAALQE